MAAVTKIVTCKMALVMAVSQNQAD